LNRILNVHNRPAMDRLKQIETFVAVAAHGSLTAAAQIEGVAPAVVGRRLDALEARLGVKLMTRTTRRITLTDAGNAFLEDGQRLVAELANAEASLSAGSVKARGHLRITAPIAFGRRHVAPLVPAFTARHPELSVSLNLSDRRVDIAQEGFDAAVRVGDAPEAGLVSLRLADDRRHCVAAPGYLERQGTPAHPSELARHQCLGLRTDDGQPGRWTFIVDGRLTPVRLAGRLDCNDAGVLHDWCLQGLGLAWRSAWEVGADIAAGRLQTVLEPFAAPPLGIYAVHLPRKNLPLRLRLWLEFLKARLGDLAGAAGAA
jgi:DNA-binding transcriptional LysR family regulator